MHNAYSNVLGCFRSAERSEAISELEHKYALAKAAISCGYRTYPTELLMAEMIDILSLNNGVAIPCCL